jgi:hypothetical protein
LNQELGASIDERIRNLRTALSRTRESKTDEQPQK